MKPIPRILLVDDDDVSNHMNHELISSYNYAEQIVIKKNGRAALSYLKNDCKTSGIYPNLILLDLKMPVIDGFEFLKEFHNGCQDIKQDIHVVILTISKNPDDIIQLNKLGRFDFIFKPLTIDHLIDIHHKYFRKLDLV